MTGIVYLDVDDEITSAAARIRSHEQKRVALVVPHGSRLATSRINFRLLAREAQSRGRRLAIVAADPASRALAASAGLPVFSTVGEYEETADGRAEAATATAAAETATASTAPDATPAAETPAPRSRRKSGPATPSGVASTILIPPIAAADDKTGPTSPPSRGTPAATAAPAGEVTATAVGAVTAGPTSPVARARSGTPPLPVIKSSRRMPFGRTALAIAGALVALLLVAGGVGAYVLLPSASIVVRPTPAVVGPIPITVRADPAASAVDAKAAVVPAERLVLDLRVADTFPATGKRVEETKATGTVTFDSINTVGPVAVPSGTRVSTLGGVVFVTTQDVTVPQAKVAGSRIEHGYADASVRAQKAGPDGNVEAAEITQVPGFLEGQQVSVANGAPTGGGAREEFPRIVQKDVDAALAALTERLSTRFAERLADPAEVPEGMTLFPATATLADPQPTTDPATLVGQELPTFELALAATGSVTAVDAAPVATVAETQLRSRVTSGYRLVAGSVDVTIGLPTVEGAIVSFPATAQASEIRLPEAAALRDEVKGLPLDDARARLRQYGTVEIVTWPDWVSTVPTVDFRLELTVESDVETEGAEGSVPSPSPSP